MGLRSSRRGHDLSIEVKEVRDWYAKQGVSDAPKTNELLISAFTAEDDFDGLWHNLLAGANF